MVVSVFDDTGRPCSGFVDAKVTRQPDRDIDFNITTLINGVYGVSLPVDELYGVFHINVVLAKPATDVLLKHDFGNRMWQRQIYEKAGKDLTKIINKDVTVAREVAKSFTDKLSLELAASAAATQNVTNQLAVRMTRDVQLFANTALGLLDKVASRSASAAQEMSKDMIEVHRDLIKRTDDVKKSLSTTANSIKDLILPSKETFASRLSTSRKRALSLKERVAGLKKADKPASAFKGPERKKDGFPDRVDREFSMPAGKFGKRGAPRKEKKAANCAKCKGKKNCVRACT